MSAFMHFLTQEWYFAVPMLLMSVTAVTLVIWRVMLNVNATTDMSRFLPAFQARLEEDGVEGALQFCRAQPGVIPRQLFAAGLENAKQGTAAMRRAMANALELEIVPDLNFLLAPILAIAKIATMVGLLGTVISMINTFQKIQDAVGGSASEHSGAIGLALFATALGLVTAIPLVFAHVLIKDWISRFENKMKSAAQKLLVLLQNVKPGSKPLKAPAADKAPGFEASALSPRR